VNGVIARATSQIAITRVSAARRNARTPESDIARRVDIKIDAKIGRWPHGANSPENAFKNPQICRTVGSRALLQKPTILWDRWIIQTRM